MFSALGRVASRVAKHATTTARRLSTRAKVGLGKAGASNAAKMARARVLMQGSRVGKLLAGAATGLTLSTMAFKATSWRDRQRGSPAFNAITKELMDTGIDVPEHSLPEPRPDLPTFTLDELLAHCDDDSAWTHFKGAVYDITDFLHGHPGGKPRLQMAAGGDLETYWKVYPEQHLRGHVVPWMDKKLRIGNLAPADVEKVRKMANFDNYYLNDPDRHPDLLHNTHHPFNGEPRIHLLTENYLTPNELFYVRLHLNVPDIDPDEWELEVSGMEVQKKKFTYEDLKTKFPKTVIVNTMQCAGNRREDFHTGDRKIFIGPHWVSSAFSCAKWGGVRMREVLRECGYDVDGLALGKASTKVKHVQFESYDMSETGLTYGASVPVDKVVDVFGDVLCAYEMNDEPLPRDHGFPVRALIPGHAGARSAKFLNKIILSDQESQKPWQIHAYRGFAPDISFEEDLWQWTKSPNVRLDQAQIIQQLPVQSLTCYPPPHSVIGGIPDEITIKGVAHGWGRGIARVDCSIDNGETLTAAELFKPQWVQDLERRQSEWGWHQWHKTFKLSDEQKAKLRRGEKLDLVLTSKACDSAFNVQPEWPGAYYNARGVVINHMYRSPITIDPNAPEGLHIPPTGTGAYEGFGNVPTGGHMMQAWKVGPWDNSTHSFKSLFNKEKETKNLETGGKPWSHVKHH